MYLIAGGKSRDEGVCRESRCVNRDENKMRRRVFEDEEIKRREKKEYVSVKDMLAMEGGVCTKKSGVSREKSKEERGLHEEGLGNTKGKQGNCLKKEFVGRADAITESKGRCLFEDEMANTKDKG